MLLLHLLSTCMLSIGCIPLASACTVRRVVLRKMISQVFYFLLPASIMYTCYLQCAVQLATALCAQPIQGNALDNSLLMFEVNFHADVVGDCAEFVLIAASLWR
jgi:hypothetical protein